MITQSTKKGNKKGRRVGDGQNFKNEKGVSSIGGGGLHKM